MSERDFIDSTSQDHIIGMTVYRNDAFLWGLSARCLVHFRAILTREMLLSLTGFPLSLNQ